MPEETSLESGTPEVVSGSMEPLESKESDSTNRGWGWKKIAFFVFVLGCVVTAIVVPIVLLSTTQNVLPIEHPTNKERIPCVLVTGQDVNQESCESVGCIFDSSGTAETGSKCFFPNKYGLGYQIEENSVLETETGIKVSLTRLNQIKSVKNAYGVDAESLKFEAVYYSDTILGLQIRDPDNVYSRRPPVALNLPTPAPLAKRSYDVVINKDATGESLTVVVKRNGSEHVLFDTSFTGMVVSKQYLQWATKLPSDRLFGIGESNRPRFKHDMNYKTWVLSARDQPPGGVQNLYGVHPFYMAFDEEGNAHGVLLLNSHVMEMTTMPLPGVIFRAIGGALEFLIFTGPTAESVVSQYLSVVGKPMLPAYWGLGFHLSRYGYDSLENMAKVVSRTRKYGIPQDVQHIDIDYMEDNIDFTYDPVRFKDLPEYMTEKKRDGLKFITQIHPAIVNNKADPNYAYFEDGRSASAYITWQNESLASEGQDLEQGDGKIMLGYLWPSEKAAFPDFFKNATQLWWISSLKKFHTTIPFDGIWLDMNEPANFGTNEEKPFNWPEGVEPWSLKCPDNDWENPPYKTLAGTFGPTNRISDKTLCMVGALGENKEYLFYEVHNLYGHSQAEPTFRASSELDLSKKRGVIITRSTYPGSGQYAGHWLGDNTSNYSFIWRTIVGILDFNMFGIPFVGSDVCGYFTDTTEPLCRRWMVDAAFHPFFRNHNGLNNIDQDPGVWPSVAKASKNALMIRYTLMPYLYNLFFRAHKDGATVVRPLHHEFSTDSTAFGIDTQYMWGDSLMFAPFYEENEVYVRDVYFSNGIWYFYKNGMRLPPLEGGVAIISGDEDEANVFVRGGKIVPTQRPAQNTLLSRKNPMGLIIALNEEGTAEGSFYWDNGDEFEPLTSKNYFDCQITYSEGTLEFTSINRNEELDLDPILSDLRILGVKTSPLPLKIKVNDGPWSKGDWHYNDKTMELDFFDLGIPIKTLSTVKWTTVADELTVECPVSYKVRNSDGTIPQEECEKVGCNWQSTNADHPSCGLPLEQKHTYVIGEEGVMNMTNGRGVMVHLKKTNSFTIHGGDFEEVHFHIYYLDNKLVRFNFVVPTQNRYVPPVPLNPPSTDFDPAENEYEAVIGDPTPGAPFHFHIKRKSNGAVLFDTSIGGFTYADQFLSISTFLPSRNVYGLGENMHPSFRHDLAFHTWPTFGRDQPPSNGNEDGAKNLNLYGSHPFYECVENDGNTHGVFLFSASALDYQFLPYPGLTYRTISGMLDFYIFLGPKPEEVIRQYTALIGRPTLVPYWSLGFQLSKYGYENLDTLKEAVQRTIDADIPLDVQFLDIDHMDNQADFTIDQANFAGLADFIAETKTTGLRWIPILDPAIDTERENYRVHENALAADVYWKWPDVSFVAEGTQYYDDYDRLGNSTAMLGYVWPVGKAAFPNFFENATQQWWLDEILYWKDNVLDFDGLWIDMNEPANFDTNKKQPWNWNDQRPGEASWNLICPENQWDDPPYVTKAALWTGCGTDDDQKLCNRRMSDKTICLFAIHGNETHLIRHYDTHNLYGWAETPITKRAAEIATGSRSLVITRATFPSSGKDSGHWLGDNASIWPDMHRSIIGMLEFNLFGMPYIGADICGFFFNTTESLCNRWMQLGSFYPFSRNHNTYADFPPPQDPGVWPKTVAESSRRALRIRYRFLPYLYTLFYEAHITGSTVIRPLHHEFPTDRAALEIDTQFLWGPAFMISPILQQDAESRTAYLPDDLWYYYHTRAFEPFTGTNIEISPPDTLTVPLHLRGGYIFPVQAPEGRNTMETRKNPMGLVITVGRDRTATGSLYWDDGEAIDPIGTGNYHLSQFKFTEDKIVNTVMHPDVTKLVLGEVRLETVEIWGYEYELSGITVNGALQTAVIENLTSEVVQISGIMLDLNNDFEIVLIRA